MLLPVKPADEGRCQAVLPKVVLSVWPRLGPSGRYDTAICNVSAVVRVAPGSSGSLTRLLFLLPPSLCTGHLTPLDISHTLLDGGNPLTHSTRGRYLKEPGAELLLAYDGVPDVSVDCGAAFEMHHRVGEPLGRIAVRFGEPLEPGRTAAVRFCFEAPRLFVESADGALHFELSVQDDRVIRQFGDDALLRRVGLPVLTVARDGVSGGADVFFYMPVDYEGARFTVDPRANLLPDYDHLGRRLRVPRRKFAWTGADLRRAPGSVLELGDSISICGSFERRKPIMTTDPRPSLGPILINSRVSRSSIVQHVGPRGVEPERLAEILTLLSDLRAQSDVLADDQADRLLGHADGVEDSTRSGHGAAARRRVRALRRIAAEALDRAPRVLETVERLDRLL